MKSKSHSKMLTSAITSCGDSPTASIASNSELFTSPRTASTRTSADVSARVIAQTPFARTAAKRTQGLGA